MKFSHRLLVVLLGITALGIVIGVLGRELHPVRDGSSVDLWKSVCGVNIEPNASNPYPEAFGIYPPSREGWFL